ncbi:TetR/AcrR family transcriptional regulator [Corynebacterium stationis]|uniref:TetR/AcrR family transcriptional regulator n=1 Tax=Corynebacterium stationis TaxID=1705 RepID=UPI00076F6B5B|nr:TetR/AcrR family transcriptional regulator [Corynebacterium stationis]AMJ45611.1 TetR family transcriptional regulator [Corynebacterium stationis]AQX72067.1 TetR family transcriptional regulator [Corynebacterium stationis]ASJ19744.1 TetR family transcriptional regulator [Corynebacterium stationis]HJG64560.1 TetR/AcrR family transcriptional regulator [Corynebacterium stationis]
MNPPVKVTPSSNRGRPGYSRDDVIDAAVREFNQRGYEATSMGHVASVLGISKSALYHHISSKEEILKYAVTRAQDALDGVVDKAEASAASPGEKVRALIYGSIEVLCADQESVTLLLRLRGNSELEMRALQRRREFTRRVIPLIDAAQASGEIRSDLDTGVLTRLMFGTVNSVIEWYETGGRLSPDEIARHAVVLLFSGAAQG